MDLLRNLKVFVVDDNPMCRELYKQYLNNMGCTDIRLFGSGMACLNHLMQVPDVVLLDHHMEPMSGMETLNCIKSINPDVYVVFFSGQRDLQQNMDALRNGAFDYIVKGDNEENDLQEVMKKITEVMRMISTKAPL